MINILFHFNIDSFSFIVDTDPSYRNLNASCTCVQARAEYLIRRDDVYAANMDAVFHFDVNTNSILQRDNRIIIMMNDDK